MPDSQPAPPAAPVSSGASESVTADLACVGCGYNLRSLRRAGDCPECGKPVAETIKARAGLFGDAKWIGRIATGCDLLLFMPLLVPVAAFLSVMFAGLLDPTPSAVGLILVDVMLLWLVGVTVLRVGLLTSPELCERDGPPRLVRRSARAVLLVTVVGALLIVVARFVQFATAFLLILLGTLAASFVLFVMLNIYCAMIANRMGEPVIGRTLRLCVLTIVGALALAAFFAIVDATGLAVACLLGALIAALTDWVAMGSFCTALGRRWERVTDA